MDDLTTFGAELGSGPNPFGGQDLWGVANTFGTGQPQTEYRLPDTVTGNAIQGSLPMQPDAPSSWSGFWQDTLRTVVGYGIARDAIKNGVQANAGYPVQQYAAPASSAPFLSGNMLLLLLVGGGLLLATRIK